MSVQAIHRAVCDGRITAAQGAQLLALLRYLRWKRRPWWDRALVVLWWMVFE